jgi:hypothetical protein
MKTVYTDRSRILAYQQCPRLRYLQYHQDGTGIESARKPLPLAVGGAVHKGLETLLRDGGAMWEHGDPAIKLPWGELSKVWMTKIEDDAVAAALADFSTHRSALALDLTEATALAAALDPKDGGFAAQLTATAQELGMSPDDPSLAELLGRQRNAAAEYDDWLWREQAALVEGMVRAYARRRLRPLLEEFEVLEVEREEEWELAEEWMLNPNGDPYCRKCGEHWARTTHNPNKKVEGSHTFENPNYLGPIRFLSRPDALLRSRADNSLYLLSFKTAASWDIRKERDAQHDMQGLSEGVGVEKRLGEWWALLHSRIMPQQGNPPIDAPSQAMYNYLVALPAPPRILGIRYEYLLKSSRYADKDLAARFGLNVWAQRSHLIRAYQGADNSWCWSYEFKKDDGGDSKLYYKNWRPKAVWEVMSIKQWIDMLDASIETMSAEDSTIGMEPRLLGYRSEAQAQGYTATHPLDDVFPAPLTVYRQDDDLRDWVEQTEAQERRVAEAVARIDAAVDDGEKRHLLNVLAPMSRRSCSYPVECVYAKSICYGGEDARRDPLGTGAFRRREPNHPAEDAVLNSVAAQGPIR